MATGEVEAMNCFAKYILNLLYIFITKNHIFLSKVV